MRLSTKVICVVLSFCAASNAVDIPGLLASLGPAPAGDPRFTNFQAPGKGDGTLFAVLEHCATLTYSSTFALPGSQCPCQSRVFAPQWQEHDHSASACRPCCWLEVRIGC